MTTTAIAEIKAGSRFQFGKNWARFLQLLDDNRIAAAVVSLRRMLEVESLGGKSFLDVGSGSGLFSLAARRLGAKVHSFDYDPQSVACTRELKRRFFPDDPNWQVEEGSALDRDYLSHLGRFDIVYSWGVLHHTGAMWRALENVTLCVADHGSLFVSLYNDQGWKSRFWHWIKRNYNRAPQPLRLPYVLWWTGVAEARLLVCSLVRWQLGEYIRSIAGYSQRSLRGMDWWADRVDWIGGYPFEVAKPNEVADFFRVKDFHLQKLAACGGSLGCNEYVFNRNDSA